MTNIELAILGLVAEEPKYGYQLEQDIEQRGMRDWTEIGFSSIYYVLKKMEKAGWITSEMHAEGQGPARKVYQLTAEGGHAYHDAVLERVESPRPRTGDFDLGLANLPALSAEEVITALESYHAALEQRLAKVNAKWERDDPDQLPYHVNALFGHSAAMIQAELEWVDSFVRELGRRK